MSLPGIVRATNRHRIAIIVTGSLLGLGLYALASAVENVREAADRAS